MSKCPYCGMMFNPPQQVMLSNKESVICRGCGETFTIKEDGYKIKIEHEKQASEHVCVDSCEFFTHGMCTNPHANIPVVEKIEDVNSGVTQDIITHYINLCGKTAEHLPKDGCNVLKSNMNFIQG